MERNLGRKQENKQTSVLDFYSFPLQCFLKIDFPFHCFFLILAFFFLTNGIHLLGNPRIISSNKLANPTIQDTAQLEYSLLSCPNRI